MNADRLSIDELALRTRHVFTIARAAAPAVRRNAWIRLRDADGVEGWGEAAATPYYGETIDTVRAVMPRYAAALNRAWAEHEADDIAGVDGATDGFTAPRLPPLERIERALESEIGRNPAARAAVSVALHDLVGKRLGQPVWRLFGLSPRAPVSSFTIGIDTPDRMRAKVEEAAGYPVLKLKLGTERDEEIVRVVREAAPRATLRIDANTGWTLKRAFRLLPLLEEAGIELIEQPFAADDLAAFRLLRDRSAIPVIADESCLVAADVARLAGCVDGVNIKLTKCGSMREAVRIVHAARAHGMLVMLGCMIESTLGVAAAVQLAPLVDFVDLDGAALLADDPFTGPGIDAHGSLRFNSAPGLGVAVREAAS
jgi:L-Ala-D/L-Glu epimerase